MRSLCAKSWIVFGCLFIFTNAALARKVLEQVHFGELGGANLPQRAVPLPEADTRAIGPSHPGAFNRQIVLVKFKNHDRVRALRVEEGREQDAVTALRGRKDVAFAELDTYQQRQFVPNDPLASNQWHHAVIGSYAAWNYSRGEPFVRIAIVDTPFQMDHPDLAQQTDPGWDVLSDRPVTASLGIEHSTMCAGMAAAAINNLAGVAGAGNCRVLPISINGLISQMYDAVIWAADHGVRVVSISWSGANSDSLNEAGQYLRTKARGVLLMAGVNGTGFLNYPNQPYIYCVSMTDEVDDMRSRFGDHIDFAAPGFNILSTTIGGSYKTASGTSYATPLVAGIVGVTMSINPTLSPDEVIQLLKDTAQDLGASGWDQFYGFGRVDFGAAAAAASATVPAITSITYTNGEAWVTTGLKAGVQCELWRSDGLETPSWQRIANAVAITNETQLTLMDVSPAPKSLYRIRFLAP